MSKPYEFDFYAYHIGALGIVRQLRNQLQCEGPKFVEAGPLAAVQGLIVQLNVEEASLLEKIAYYKKGGQTAEDSPACHGKGENHEPS